MTGLGGNRARLISPGFCLSCTKYAQPDGDVGECPPPRPTRGKISQPQSKNIQCIKFSVRYRAREASTFIPFCLYKNFLATEAGSRDLLQWVVGLIQQQWYRLFLSLGLIYTVAC